MPDANTDQKIADFRKSRKDSFIYEILDFVSHPTNERTLRDILTGFRALQSTCPHDGDTHPGEIITAATNETLRFCSQCGAVVTEEELTQEELERMR